ncbi:MAG: arsenate reductase ArsC [Chloroflexota bacterium]
MASPIRVLFVCTGNSARSLLAEAVLRQRGGPGFEVHSAGTSPRGVNPLTVRVLEDAGIATVDLASKGLDSYLGEPFDHVITVCDDARQVCPVFPGGAPTRHWSLVDPAAVEGPEEGRLAAFRETLELIETHIAGFLVEAAAANVRSASS